MMNCNYCLMTTILALGLFFSASANAATLDRDAAPQPAIEQCLAEIREHTDVSDASRVHHDVESRQLRMIGHVLKIETQVFDSPDSEAIRQYAAICKIGIGNKPFKFRIAEINPNS